jgi:hypothetical protein
MPVTPKIPRLVLLFAIFGLTSAVTLTGCSQNKTENQTQNQTAPAAPAAPATSTPLPTHPDTVVVRMGEYLKTLTSFAITIENSYDEALPSGLKIQYLASGVITVRRPDRLRADMSSDDGDRSIIYDGKSLTVYGKTLNVYAAVDAPPTLDEMFNKVLNEYNLGLPLVDILYQSVHGTLLDNVEAGIVLGRSRIGGVECDHVAFHQADVDWQLWVEASATPLPRRIVITTLGEPGQPQYEVDMKWNLSPTIDDSMFAFVPPGDAARIKLATLAAQVEAATDSSKK